MSTFAKALKKQKPATGMSEVKLRNYQSDAVRWVSERPASGLFLSPGLGKTLIILVAFHILRLAGVIDRLFIVAPLRVCYSVWPNEVEKWKFDYSVGILHGSKKAQTLAEDHDIYVINPHGLPWLLKNTPRNFFAPKTWLVIDESSQFRNGRSQRFKTMKRMLKFFNRRTILTGTPAPNGLEGLWGQIYLLDTGIRLGEYITQYRNRWFYPSGYGGYTWLPQEGAKEKIYAAIDDLVMHKGRDELDLPPLLSNMLRVKLSARAQAIYDDMQDEFIAAIDEMGIVAAVNGAVASGKLRQIASGAVYDEHRTVLEVHDEKIQALLELIDELEGSPIMVFYEYEHELDRLKKAIPTAQVLGGGTSAAAGARIQADWNRGEVPVLLLHPASAGHGLNLQESPCTDLCWFTITWDLELYEQAYSRVWRSGVEHPVTMHHLVASGTLDEVVYGSLVKKSKLQDDLKRALKK